MKVDFTTQTDGSGLYTKKKKSVKITEILVRGWTERDDQNSRLYAFFDKSNWDVETDDVIYDDPCWMETFQNALMTLGFSENAVSSICYSEHGAQGEDYVDMDVEQPFIEEMFALGLDKKMKEEEVE